MKNISNPNHTRNADNIGDTSNIVTLDFEQNLLKQYIKLERKTQAIVDKILSNDASIDVRTIDKIEQHLLTLKVCLESLEEEKVQESGCKTSSGKEPKTHINRQIDERKFHLINSMEKILEHLIKLQERGESNVISISRGLGFCAPHIGINQGSWSPRFV